jgi:hypothetical protein
MIEKTEGLAELDNVLATLPKATARNVLIRVGKKALEPFLADVKAMAPVSADPSETPKRPQGTLRDSYVIGTKLNKTQARGVRREGKNFAEVYAGTNDVAGVQTEFGNEHQAAQPHARPAWDGTKQQVLKSVGALLWDEILKAKGRLAKKAARIAAK